jgi:hypothetical protein
MLREWELEQSCCKTKEEDVEHYHIGHVSYIQLNAATPTLRVRFGGFGRMRGSQALDV